MSLLTFNTVTKTFRAITVLSGTGFSIEPGEVIGLMADYSVGKSTIAKIIAGNFPPAAGNMHLDGPVTGAI